MKLDVIRRSYAIAFVTAVGIVGCQTPLSAQSTNIAGVVKDTSGQPVTGALVKVRNDEKGLSFLVVSRAQGRYTTPNLPPGKYAIQAFAGEHQSTTSSLVEVRSGVLAAMDLSLTADLKLPATLKRMSDADYAATMPAGESKSSIASRCATCHNLQWVVSARKTPEQWQETVDRMRDHMQGRDRPLNNISSEADLIQLDGMVEYFAKNYPPDAPVDPRVVEQWLLLPGGPAHPNRNLPRTVLQGAAAQYVAMEFSLPSGAMPHDIAVDSAGIAWTTETAGGMLGRMDANSLTYTRISPLAGKDPKVQLNSVAIDPKDHVWFVDDGPNARMLEYDSQSHNFRTFAIPEYRYPIPPGVSPARLVALRFLDGNVWGTGIAANWIVRLDPASGKTIEFPVPKGATPNGLAIGGDKRIWFAAEIGNFVGRLEPMNGLFSRYDLQQPNSDVRGMAADSEGNLWVAATEAGKLLKVDYHNGNFTEFTPPNPDSGPLSVDVDTKQNYIWFNESFSDKISRLDPRTGTFVEFSLPSSDVDVRRIQVDPHNPNRVWWSGYSSNKIGYIEVTP